jgi:hypothetical protein
MALGEMALAAGWFMGLALMRSVDCGIVEAAVGGA